MRLSGFSKPDQEVSAMAPTSGEPRHVPMGPTPWARILRRGVAQFGKLLPDCAVPIFFAWNLILLFWWIQGGGDKVNQLIATAAPVPIPLESEVLNLPAGGNATLAFVVPHPGRLKVAPDVIEGNQIDVLVSDVTPLPREGVELRRVSVPDFSVNQITAYRRTTHVNPGTYCIVLLASPQLLPAKSSHIAVKVELYP
jgi:hypothetical protein